MASTTTTPVPTFIPSISGPVDDRERPIPITRLVRVELRKVVDTRAGRWLFGSIIGGAALTMAISVLVGVLRDSSYAVKDLVQFANLVPMGLLLPVLGVMAVTGEWSQRTNVVTFTLEPRRQRIVTAKLAAGVLMALVASVAAFATGAVALGVFDLLGGDAVWTMSADMVVSFAMFHLIGVLTGFAFGMLILNTPAAIVAFFAVNFVLPTLFFAAAEAWGWAESLQPWVNFNEAQEPITEGTLTGMQWGPFVVAALIWFALPVALGVRRILRAEIK